MIKHLATIEYVKELISAVTKELGNKLSGKEDVSNKSTSLNNSDKQYPTCNAVNAGLSVKAETTTYHTTIETSNWIQIDEWRYKNEIFDLEDILDVDNPIVDLDIGEDGLEHEEFNALIEAWSNVVSIVTSAGLVEVYASKSIDIDIPIQLKVVR